MEVMKHTIYITNTAYSLPCPFLQLGLKVGKHLITLFNTQNVMETRPAQLYEFEAAEFENDIEIFILALVFELQL